MWWLLSEKHLDELETSVHALDRVLLSIGFTVPKWYKPVHTVAYWDMYGKPDERIPPFDWGVRIAGGVLDYAEKHHQTFSKAQAHCARANPSTDTSWAPMSYAGCC